MNGDITLVALCHCHRASKVISRSLFLLFSMRHFTVISCR